MTRNRTNCILLGCSTVHVRAYLQSIQNEDLWKVLREITPKAFIELPNTNDLVQYILVLPAQNSSKTWNYGISMVVIVCFFTFCRFGYFHGLLGFPGLFFASFLAQSLSLISAGLNHMAHWLCTAVTEVILTTFLGKKLSTFPTKYSFSNFQWLNELCSLPLKGLFFHQKKIFASKLFQCHF